MYLYAFPIHFLSLLISYTFYIPVLYSSYTVLCNHLLSFLYSANIYIYIFVDGDDGGIYWAWLPTPSLLIFILLLFIFFYLIVEFKCTLRLLKVLVVFSCKLWIERLTTIQFLSWLQSISFILLFLFLFFFFDRICFSSFFLTNFPLILKFIKF